MADPCAVLLLLPQVEDSMLDMLLAYRKKCASDSPAGQLILPEGLRVLPLFTLCTHKMLALRPNANVRDMVLLSRAGILGYIADWP